MKWQRGYQSDDVEDDRGRSPGIGGSGLLGPALWIGSRFGLPGILVALAVVFVLPRLLGGGAQALGPGQVTQQTGPVSDERKQFVSFVFDDAQRSWSQAFAESGKPYRKAKLVLFTDSTASGCGTSSSAVGPFYCPADERVYIDLSFYDELARRFGAPGDFAQAYVIAHEMGHHIQNLLGIERRMQKAGGPSEGANSNSVKLELQADCFAGIWAHSTARRDLLEQGDVEEGLQAASAVGDDRLQKQATGTVQPETWTHGSAAQRAQSFKRGYASGSLKDCDTFAQTKP
ncbi:MAG TPA: neutral zinc metallopeptidase [Polyangiaceae bacterium]|nr:neutral zinc metallopeptidase [Polyangiaceae bacterium]